MADLTRRAAECFARLLVARMRCRDPEKVAAGLREGTLQTLMATDVMAAWKEYKRVVPQKILEETDYFREALNDILAEGEKVFK